MRAEQTILPDWEVAPAIVAFSTTRQGGVSKPPYNSLNTADHVGDESEKVLANRAILEERQRKELSWQWLDQVHGTDVAIVDQAGPVLTADAILTTSTNLVCCVQTADCLPLFVAARDGTEVAAIHAGWKGLACGVIENTLARMSTPAEKAAVWLGPAIGPCHFEVGAEVRERFLDAADAGALTSQMQACFAASRNSGKYMADLYGIAKLKLAALGIEAISGGDRCTHCDSKNFFSYRRDGVTDRKSVV